MAQNKTKEEKVVITPELRRIWITIRRAWVTSFQAFSYNLEALSDKQADLLYNAIRYSLYKGSYAEILRAHPELRELLKSDEDRMCMHDIYEVLSVRLDRKEELPKDIQMSSSMKGRIGRSAPDLSS